MNENIKWSDNGGTDAHLLRRLMAHFSLVVRKCQYHKFLEVIMPSIQDKVLDVGTTPDTTLADSNFFESVYPYPKQVTIASVEECGFLVKKYGLNGYVGFKAGEKLPFDDKSFDIVTSWATLEHVGSVPQQQFFIEELCRVGKKVFLTTPDKHSIYEPHTGLFFFHWLPPVWFRRFLTLLGKHFWAKEKNLNIVSYRNIKKITGNFNLEVFRMKTLMLPSHMLIYRYIYD